MGRSAQFILMCSEGNLLPEAKTLQPKAQAGESGADCNDFQIFSGNKGKGKVIACPIMC